MMGARWLMDDPFTDDPATRPQTQPNGSKILAFLWTLFELKKTAIRNAKKLIELNYELRV